MRRATVSISHQDTTGNPLGREEISGYACEIDGIPLVVHRSVERGPNDEVLLRTDHWTVTEPRTGMAIWSGLDSFDALDKSYTRSYAIHRADCVIAEQGGAPAVEKAVAEKLKAEAEGGGPR